MDTRELIWGCEFAVPLVENQAHLLLGLGYSDTKPLLIYAVTVSCAGKDAATLVRATG
jgi:hypothetical protein